MLKGPSPFEMCLPPLFVHFHYLVLFYAVVSFILHLCINVTNFHLLKRRGTWENTNQNTHQFFYKRQVKMFTLQYLRFSVSKKFFIFFVSQVSLFFWVFGPLIWPFCEVSMICRFLFICHVFLFFVLFLFICARGVSENWPCCSVTSSDSVTPRRFFTTPTTRCCQGCGPTAPPTCRGTGMQTANHSQPHGSCRQVANGLLMLTHSRDIQRNAFKRYTHKTKSRLTASETFCVDVLCV